MLDKIGHDVRLLEPLTVLALSGLITFKGKKFFLEKLFTLLTLAGEQVKKDRQCRSG